MKLDLTLEILIQKSQLQYCHNYRIMISDCIAWSSIKFKHACINTSIWKKRAFSIVHISYFCI